MASEEEAKGRVATEKEVEKAIIDLTDEDLSKIMLAAKLRINVIGNAAHGREAQDLYGEAILATLEGERKWYLERVDFVGHIMGVMRSKASHWAEQDAIKPIVAESSLGAGDSEQMRSFADTKANVSVTPEEEVIGAKFKQYVLDMFPDDKYVRIIVEASDRRLRWPEISDHYEITEDQYRAAIKRLRRKRDWISKEWPHEE
ncbi:MAG: hypothetical protein KDD35_03085 [Bdellovibrionales bacterium]|nr:hypothetical protein [Bdellovibrionales bacterium]